MKRTQAPLDEDTYMQLQQKAIDQGISMSALIRQILKECLGTRQPPRERLDQFEFIGSGRSAGSAFDPISERHDEALTEDFAR